MEDLTAHKHVIPNQPIPQPVIPNKPVQAEKEVEKKLADTVLQSREGLQYQKLQRQGSINPETGIAGIGPKVLKTETLVRECFEAADTATGYEGAMMDDNMTRDWYNACMDHFKTLQPELDRKLSAKELTLSEYAKIAYNVRHEARTHTRELMEDRRALAWIKARDLQDYGHEDGPQFDELVNKAVAKGKSIDDAYRKVIASSTHTNKWVNAFLSTVKVTKSVGESVHAFLNTMMVDLE